MSAYKLSAYCVIRLRDGAQIPPDPANTDYAAFLAWQAAGNTPDPADVPDPKLALQSQIDAIERSTLMNRGAREGWIAVIRKEAAAQGITDDALIASANPFFARLMAVDGEIRALRSQLA